MCEVLKKTDVCNKVDIRFVSQFPNARSQPVVVYGVDPAKCGESASAD